METSIDNIDEQLQESTVSTTTAATATPTVTSSTTAEGHLQELTCKQLQETLCQNNLQIWKVRQEAERNERSLLGEIALQDQAWKLCINSQIRRFEKEVSKLDKERAKSLYQLEKLDCTGNNVFTPSAEDSSKLRHSHMSVTSIQRLSRAELVKLINERDEEISCIMGTMEQNERAMMEVQEDKEKNWENFLQEVINIQEKEMYRLGFDEEIVNKCINACLDKCVLLQAGVKDEETMSCNSKNSYIHSATSFLSTWIRSDERQNKKQQSVSFDLESNQIRQFSLH